MNRERLEGIFDRQERKCWIVYYDAVTGRQLSLSLSQARNSAVWHQWRIFILRVMVPAPDDSTAELEGQATSCAV